MCHVFAVGTLTGSPGCRWGRGSRQVGAPGESYSSSSPAAPRWKREALDQGMGDNSLRTVFTEG